MSGRDKPEPDKATNIKSPCLKARLAKIRTSPMRLLKRSQCFRCLKCFTALPKRGEGGENRIVFPTASGDYHRLSPTAEDVSALRALYSWLLPSILPTLTNNQQLIIRSQQHMLRIGSDGRSDRLARFNRPKLLEFAGGCKNVHDTVM